MSPLFSLDSLFAALEQVAENVVGDAPDERDDFVVRCLIHYCVRSFSIIPAELLLRGIIRYLTETEALRRFFLQRTSPRCLAPPTPAIPYSAAGLLREFRRGRAES